MGSVIQGIPRAEVEFLKERMHLDLFVEGGTYTGGSAIRMSKIFPRVITIEKSPEMYEIASRNIDIKGVRNIELRKGDTRTYLHEILSSHDNILFWLDAHWSGAKTYGEGDECPLIQELETIFSFSKNYVILIDDARLFLAPPPSPHDFREWPGIRDIVEVLPSGHELLVHDDVIYVVPDQAFNDFRSYLQKVVTRNWNNARVAEKKRKLPNLLSLFKGK